MSPRPAAAQRAVALAALLAMAAGAVELHGADARHRRVGPDGPVFACDLDHGRATHVEAAREVERHECAACLHRLHGRSGAARAFVVAGLAAGGDALPPPLPAAAPFPPLAAAPSRGPPLA
ncbi:MAG TPA: hypothetical protein VF100_04825 [Thermoanaerobaculia bacterium]